MKIGIVKETQSGETRVAATPDTVKKLRAKGLEVLVEKSAGLGSHFTDDAYRKAGAELVDAQEAYAGEIIFKVQKPKQDEIGRIKKGAILVSFLDPCANDQTLEKLAQAGVAAFALELVPRISRAQSIDALSSQANIGGYRATLEAARLYGNFFAMMMTAAGSAKPAKVMVLGAGVAGLQAIATAKRLGAQVFAFDIRPEVKEEIMSLGGKFVELDLGESGAGEGGYAKQLSKEAQQRQQALLQEEIKKMDIVISTALIPCKPAPVLITEDAVKGMPTGSVIIDMAAISGGNCPLTKADKTIVKHGVTICGITNFPALVPTDASSFYARNLLNFISLLLKDEDGKPALKDFSEDEITAASLATHDGAVRFQRPN
ncbi:MAG: Re/Si-specific NAD(P)(+) transhydrogenase subunit alpha [Acidiferrobacterales bacterium]